jgi:hypothetical protein
MLDKNVESILKDFFEKITIAWEYASVRKWARAHPQEVLDKNRPTVGEMLPLPEKSTNLPAT